MDSCALISLPWSAAGRPSAALASLSSYIRNYSKDITVDTFHFYVDLAGQIGFDRYLLIAEDSYKTGESLSGSILYPQSIDKVKSEFIEAFKDTNRPNKIFGTTPFELGNEFDFIQQTFQKCIESWVNETDWSKYNLIGLTTSFGQLFANLAFAKSFKKKHPQVKIVMGGSTVSSRVGPSLLQEYPFLDYVIQGEGEQPLLMLLKHVLYGDKIASDTIQSRDSLPREKNRLTPHMELASMNDLSIPNFDEYAERMKRYQEDWWLAIEGSRGCWWDRSRKTNDINQTCYFCNLNVQWAGYREKSVDRVIEEMLELSKKHKNNRIFFLDNILRSKQVLEFAEKVKNLDEGFLFFYEMRSHIKSYELLVLWEAGLERAQFGIESLSTSMLKKIGKGTSVIMNLNSMKLCQELGIVMDGNMIQDFPSTTKEEVDETVNVIQNFALGFYPLVPSFFWLGIDSTVERAPERFGISNIRNADFYKSFLPEEIYNRITLFDRSYDDTQTANWLPVQDAIKNWSAKYWGLRGAPSIPHSMFYLESKDFVRIFDYRFGPRRTYVFEGPSKDIYMFCQEVNHFDDIALQFPDFDEQDLREFLDQLILERLMFKEEDKYLSLACAARPSETAKRIRKAYHASKKVVPLSIEKVS